MVVAGRADTALPNILSYATAMARTVLVTYIFGAKGDADSPLPKVQFTKSDATTMAIAVKKGKVTTKTYEVSGDTLADVWKSIQSNGAKHKGSTRAGKTTCHVNMDSSSSKIEFTTTEGKKNWEAEAKMTKGTLTYDCTVQVPKLKSDKNHSDDAKKEWARFMKALEAHEQEHVADFGKTVEKIAKDLEGLTASGTGADKKKAEKDAFSKFGKAFNKDFSPAENDKRLDAGADALDSGGHGPTLKTSIQ